MSNMDMDIIWFGIILPMTLSVCLVYTTKSYFTCLHEDSPMVMTGNQYRDSSLPPMTLECTSRTQLQLPFRKTKMTKVNTKPKKI